ncbi:hypothetical protein COCON_G00134830 [Conger conger]|uniref:Uncharacterized protein n=1 Tax=Conger conger TaxID=82655 RepID=A0A9Q1DF36_CONCO|nr:hypothetical protein COCON_G00134830 [Conger conger]
MCLSLFDGTLPQTLKEPQTQNALHGWNICHRSTSGCFVVLNVIIEAANDIDIQAGSIPCIDILCPSALNPGLAGVTLGKSSVRRCTQDFAKVCQAAVRCSMCNSFFTVKTWGEGKILTWVLPRYSFIVSHELKML